MKAQLSKLERIPMREAWRHVANDFTPWLTDVLGKTTRAIERTLATMQAQLKIQRIGSDKAGSWKVLK